MTDETHTDEDARAVARYKEYIAAYKDDLLQVEKAIAGNFRSDVALIPQISGYLTGGGGKRIRPSLAIVSARLCGYEGSERPVALSVVVEYVHAATLLHDDVVDEADKRRGKDSANEKFGNEAAVLVGDFLFAKAFEIMSLDGDMRIVQTVSTATKTLAEGEVLQLVNTCNVDATEEDYMETIRRKTGSLIEASCRIGAILGGAAKEQEEALAAYGRCVGTAFQLADDALDYVAEAQSWGKPIGADLAEGKVTMPLILALRKADEGERAVIERAVMAEEPTKEDFDAVLDILLKYDAVSETVRLAKGHAAEAIKHLETFPASPHREALAAIAAFSAVRKV